MSTSSLAIAAYTLRFHELVALAGLRADREAGSSRLRRKPTGQRSAVSSGDRFVHLHKRHFGDVRSVSRSERRTTRRYFCASSIQIQCLTRPSNCISTNSGLEIAAAIYSTLIAARSGRLRTARKYWVHLMTAMVCLHSVRFSKTPPTGGPRDIDCERASVRVPYVFGWTLEACRSSRSWRDPSCIWPFRSWAVGPAKRRRLGPATQFLTLNLSVP
jgi:hypothetical protein